MIHLFRPLFCAVGLAFALAHPPVAAAPASPYLEELTSPELQQRIAQGTHTVLLPIGGTEQNGPHMTLGKHNARAHVLAGRIASALGDAVVAPVLAYVPEGGVHPPQAHMRFAGTISIPDTTFEILLESSARSLCEHGLSHVVLLGDHGGYQASLQQVARRFAKVTLKGAPPCHVQALSAYYDVTQAEWVALLKKRGYTAAEIGSHAGLADTALTLATDPASVRLPALAGPGLDAAHGVHGDPRRATVDLGQAGVALIVEHSVAAIRADAAARP